jgi:hypothetical protein
MIIQLTLDNLILHDIVVIRFERKDGLCEIANLQASIHRKMLNLRRLSRFLSEDDFVKAFNNATDKTEILLYIEAGNKERVVQWTRNQLKDCIESYGYGELRRLAQSLGVKHYLHKTRDALLSEIFQIRNDDGNQRTNSTVTQPDEETHAGGGS